MRSAVLGALAWALALPVLGGVPAATAQRQVQTGHVVVHSRSFELKPASDPQLLTVGCDGDEQLVSGGYTTGDPDSHVTFSYPADARGTPTSANGRPTAWTVGVISGTKTPGHMQVSAVCLAGGDAVSTVSSHTETHDEFRFSLAADCPDGTVRVGGGYFSQWNPILGTGAVIGSYPSSAGRWAIDVQLLPGDPDTHARATVTVSAVCLSAGVRVADLAPVVLHLSAGPQVCSSGSGGFNLGCSTPWTGSQEVTCPRDEVLSGAGYQVITGSLPGNYSVRVDAPINEPVWRVVITGSTASPSPISLNITPLCLIAVVTPASTGAPSVAPTDTTGPVARGPDLIRAAYVGGGVLLLLLLVLLVVLTMRRAVRRRAHVSSARPSDGSHQPAPAAAVDVVVRAQRSAYRLNGFREVL